MLPGFLFLAKPIFTISLSCSLVEQMSQPDDATRLHGPKRFIVQRPQALQQSVTTQEPVRRWKGIQELIGVEAGVISPPPPRQICPPTTVAIL